jgi:uncharacterized protein YoxC
MKIHTEFILKIYVALAIIAFLVFPLYAVDKKDSDKKSVDITKKQNDKINDKIKELTSEYKRHIKARDYEKARNVCAKIMEMAPKESKVYKIAQNNKIYLDKYLRRRDRK